MSRRHELLIPDELLAAHLRARLTREILADHRVQQGLIQDVRVRWNVIAPSEREERLRWHSVMHASQAVTGNDEVQVQIANYVAALNSFTARHCRLTSKETGASPEWLLSALHGFVVERDAVRRRQRRTLFPVPAVQSYDPVPGYSFELNISADGLFVRGPETETDDGLYQPEWIVPITPRDGYVFDEAHWRDLTRAAQKEAADIVAYIRRRTESAGFRRWRTKSLVRLDADIVALCEWALDGRVSPDPYRRRKVRELCRRLDLELPL